MPNPRFEPLTLSREEWELIKTDATPTTGTRVYRGCDTQQARQLIAECEAQAQAADSLQRDHELLQAENTRIQKYAADLEAQLAQAQQERDALVEAQKVAGIEKTRAEQAEAALEEMLAPDFVSAVRTAIMACDHCAMEGRKVGDPAYYLGWEIAVTNLKLLAELQRRRSPRGQE